MLSTLWMRRLLSICPVLIAVLWVAGVSRFRAYELQPREWAVVVAAAFALHVIGRRLNRNRPLPQLPPGSNPALISLLAAAILGVLAAIVAGLFEALVDQYRPATVALPWRAAWHAACSFGATYCGFLYRLGFARRPPPRSPPPPR